MADESVEDQFRRKDTRAGQIRRQLAASLLDLRPGPGADRARELLSRPERLSALPLAHFRVEKIHPDDIRQRGRPPLEMAELRDQIQRLEDRKGEPRERAKTIREYLIAEAVILPRITRAESDGLLWVRFLMDGEAAEEALQHVARLTNRNRDTVHRNVLRFFSASGLRPPVALPQPARNR